MGIRDGCGANIANLRQMPVGSVQNSLPPYAHMPIC